MFFKHIPHVISTFLRKFATKTTHKTMMIGRNEEVKILQTAAHADESKFVAVYGRRRVGKTFLVRETFNNTIDLLIDRSDAVINLCEIKYSKAEFQITSGIDNNLQNKRERFIQETRTGKAVQLTMITTMGLMQNSYAWDIQSVVTMDDLFI
mgnify:FL=1